jgi:hypothetical protein
MRTKRTYSLQEIENYKVQLAMLQGEANRLAGSSFDRRDRERTMRQIRALRIQIREMQANPSGD